MNVGGLFVLFLVAAAGVLSLVLIVGNANMAAPVDSIGNTVSAKDNSTRTAIANEGPSIVPIAAGVTLIVGFLILCAIIIYFAAARVPSRSRY